MRDWWLGELGTRWQTGPEYEGDKVIMPWEVIARVISQFMEKVGGRIQRNPGMQVCFNGSSSGSQWLLVMEQS